MRKILNIIKQYINVLLMAISPMALLMLIVAFIMFLDYHGQHQRRKEALEEVVLTTQAKISSCYQENRYCYAEFTDEQGNERYGKLDWRYYDEKIVTQLMSLERDDTIRVRYAQQRYENEIILIEYYDDFRNYKGYFYEMGGIALVSWIILILHPEIMLFSLVDDFGAIWDQKWKGMMKPL